MQSQNIHPDTPAFVRFTTERGWGVYVHFDPTCSNILKRAGHTVKQMPYSEAAKLELSHCGTCYHQSRQAARGTVHNGIANAEDLLVAPNETIFGGAKVEGPAKQPAYGDDDDDDDDDEPEVVELPSDD